MKKGTVVEYVWSHELSKTKSKTNIFRKEMCSVEDLPFMSVGYDPMDKEEHYYTDIPLVPVRLYPDPFRPGQWLALCELYRDSSLTKPFWTNKRSDLAKFLKEIESEEAWVGFEQEFYFFERDATNPLGWKSNYMVNKYDYVDFHCDVSSINGPGREIMEDFLTKCELAGVELYGIIAERSPSQWEFQTGPSEILKGCDDLIIARYILERCAEIKRVDINLFPKVNRVLDSSGLHVNISTKSMREDGGYKAIVEACERVCKNHLEDIKNYGCENKLRLIGNIACTDYSECSFGDDDRKKAIRIPGACVKNKKGYFEDRRPASHADPYLVLLTLLRSALGKSETKKSEITINGSG